MQCPFCGDADTRVIDSRLAGDGREIRRRRECGECARRFTTRERVEETLPKIVKHDARREEFDRAKLSLGILRSCDKRPVSADAIDRMVDRIERRLQDAGEREVTSKTVGELAMAELMELDHLAAVRFASVFYDFQSVEDYSEFFARLRGDDAQEGN